MWGSGVTVASSIGTNPLRGFVAIYNDLFGSYLHATNACKHFPGTSDNFCDGGSKSLIWGSFFLPLHGQLEAGAG